MGYYLGKVKSKEQCPVERKIISLLKSASKGNLQYHAYLEHDWSYLYQVPIAIAPDGFALFSFKIIHKMVRRGYLYYDLPNRDKEKNLCKILLTPMGEAALKHAFVPLVINQSSLDLLGAVMHNEYITRIHVGKGHYAYRFGVGYQVPEHKIAPLLACGLLWYDCGTLWVYATELTDSAKNGSEFYAVDPMA